MKWITNRLKERSSWNGIIIGVPAVIVILGIMPLTKVIVWGALAWGLYNIWMSEYFNLDSITCILINDTKHN